MPATVWGDTERRLHFHMSARRERVCGKQVAFVRRSSKQWYLASIEFHNMSDGWTNCPFKGAFSHRQLLIFSATVVWLIGLTLWSHKWELRLFNSFDYGIFIVVFDPFRSYGFGSLRKFSFQFITELITNFLAGFSVCGRRKFGLHLAGFVPKQRPGRWIAPRKRSRDFGSEAESQLHSMAHFQ